MIRGGRSRSRKDGRVGSAVGVEAVGIGWKAFFWAACLFNCAIGALGVFEPEASVDGRIVGVLVFCFGLVYLFAARNPLRFGPVLWAGVIGKAGVIGLLGPSVLEPGGNPVILTVLSLDAAFALGFLVFLIVKRNDLAG